MNRIINLKNISRDKIKSALKAKKSFYLKFIIAFAALASFFILIRYYRQHIVIEELPETIQVLGFWAPVLYVIFYVLVAGNIVPSIILKVLAGGLFGITEGIILVTVAATATSSIKFLLARRFFRDRIKRKIDTSRRLRAIDEMIEKEGWKMLVILRNVPIISSMFLNYICALTRISFWQFSWASFLGHLPTTVLYVYLGYLLGCTADMQLVKSHAVYQKYTIYIALAAILAATFYFTYLMKKMMLKKAGAD